MWTARTCVSPGPYIAGPKGMPRAVPHGPHRAFATSQTPSISSTDSEQVERRSFKLKSKEHHARYQSITINNTALSIATGAVAAIATACVLALAIAAPAGATAQFAKETGKSCGTCHVDPKGAGPLTPFGEKFKANGNKMP